MDIIEFCECAKELLMFKSKKTEDILVSITMWGYVCTFVFAMLVWCGVIK